MEFSPELDAISKMMLSMPEYEPLELIWRKGPVEEPLRGGLPASIFESQPILKLSTPTEDEMAAWLHYPIGTSAASADFNRQTGAGSSSLPSVLLGKTAESDCQMGPEEIKTMHTEKAEISGRQKGVESRGRVRSGFEGHNEVTKQNSPVESKFSTINSDEKRKDKFRQTVPSRKLHITRNHNISEQKRRSKINEKMKTLQGLVPRSSKLDKASILDATIAHVKSLQKQLKMMTTGFPMRPPILSPGPAHIQSMPLMPSMGIDTGMNMAAMGIRTGMPPFGLPMLYPHINQPIQAPMLQMPGQHMATGMFAYLPAGDLYQFPSVVPDKHHLR